MWTCTLILNIIQIIYIKGDVHVECAECQKGVRSIAGLAKPEP